MTTGMVAIHNDSGPHANVSTTNTYTGLTYGLEQINAPDTVGRVSLNVLASLGGRV